MPIYRFLPERPRIRQLKKQAKELLDHLQSNQPDAWQRLQDHHPRASELGLTPTTRPPKLSDAHLILAREYNFPSWPLLKAYTESQAPDHAPAFFEAVRMGHVDQCLSFLGQHPELIHARGANNSTPLHIAADADQPHIASLLLEAGADLEAQTSWGGTPLANALIKGHEGMRNLLLSRGANLFGVMDAAACGRVDLLHSFFDETGTLKPNSGKKWKSVEVSPGVWQTHPASQDPQEILNTALEDAARNDQVEAIDFLLDHGAEVNSEGFFGASPAHWAATNNKLNALRRLVERGADLQKRDPTYAGTPFGWAGEFHRKDAMDLLLSLGFELNIWDAANFGYIDQVKEQFAKHPEQLNDPDSWGTPLAEAALHGHADIVTWLLQQGADPSIRTRREKTPLQHAIERGHQEVVRILTSFLPRE